MYEEDKNVKKRGLRAIAWVMLLAMMFSSTGIPKRAYAAEIPEDALFWTTLEELTNGEVCENELCYKYGSVVSCKDGKCF